MKATAPTRKVATAWRAWFEAAPSTTRRARLYDLRQLATFMRIPRRAGSNEQRARLAAHALLELDAPRARARLVSFREWSQERVASASVARRLGTLSSWLAEAEQHGLGAGAVKVKRPKQRKYKGAPKGPPWSDVLEVARRVDAREAAMLWLLASVGLRRSEVVSLCWRDVDLAARPPRVHVLRKGGIEEVRSIAARSAAALAQVRSEATRAARARGEQLEQSARVFLGQRGALTDSGLARIVSAWRLGAPHAFRHSGATQLRQQGASASELQAWLGHATLATADVYARAIDDPAGKCTALLEASS